MGELRDEEEWARGLMEIATGSTVVQHDDGSRPGMHDLWILPDDSEKQAVEVTAAADPEAIPLWKLLDGTGERWIDNRLAGGWSVEFRPTARARAVRQDLPDFLLDLERLGVQRLSIHELPSPLGDRLASLGITTASQLGTDFPGSIYPLVDQSVLNGLDIMESPVASLPSWVGDFLREPERADNLAKLERSGVSRRHVFIIVPAFSTAPANVVSVLLSDLAPTNLPDPSMPPEVTDIWVASTWAEGAGLRWSSADGWRRLKKISTGR